MLEQCSSEFVRYLAMASAFGFVGLVLVCVAYIAILRAKQRTLKALKQAPGVAASHATNTALQGAKVVLNGVKAVVQKAPETLGTIRRKKFDRWSDE